MRSYQPNASLSLASIFAAMNENIRKLSVSRGESQGTSSYYKKGRSSERETRKMITKARNKKAHKLGRRNHRH